MKIEITSVDGLKINFKCAVGNASAIWKSDRINAVVGKIYYSEFAVNDILIIGQNAELSQNDQYKIYEKNDFIFLNGFIDGKEDDNDLLYLRLGQDSLTMIEYISSDIEPGNWIFFKVNYRNFEIYPFD